MAFLILCLQLIERIDYRNDSWVPSLLISTATAVVYIRRTMTLRDSLEGDSVYPSPENSDHQVPGAIRASDESLVEIAQKP